VKYIAAKGHTITALDKTSPPIPLPEKATFKEIDLRDYSAVKNALEGHDAVIHLGAIPRPSPELEDWQIYHTNVTTSYNVLHAAGALGITRVSMASSANAIGATYSKNGPYYTYFPMDEAHPAKPDDAYGLSKLTAEIQATSLCTTYPSLRIASFRLHACMDAPPPKHYTSMAVGAKELWGWVSYTDTARACLLGITSEGWKGNEVFNIVSERLGWGGFGGEEENVDALQLKEKFWGNCEVRDPGWWDEGEGKLGRFRGFYTTEKARRLLGWWEGDE